jgi:hypothetical protein
LLLQVLLTVPEPMALFMAVEAFIIRRRARLAFCLRLGALGLIRNLVLAFSLWEVSNAYSFSSPFEPSSHDWGSS